MGMENGHLQTGGLQTGHFEIPRFPHSELQRLDLTHFWQITLIYSDKNAFNPTSQVQNIGNGAFNNIVFQGKEI